MADLYQGVEAGLRRRAHQIVARGDRHCDKGLDGCGRSWDPSKCYHCERPKEPGEGETCPQCGRDTPADRCVSCGKDGPVRCLSLAEALGLDAAGRRCLDCPWSSEASRAVTCPDCGSRTISRYAEAPNLTEGLDDLTPEEASLPTLIYLAEGRIAKDEGGVPLDTCLATWLARHGIEDAVELDMWEDLLHAVAEGHRRGTAARFERERKTREDTG